VDFPRCHPLIAILQVLTQLAQHVAWEQEGATAAAAAAAGPLGVRALTAAPAAPGHLGALLGEPLAQLAISLVSAAPWLLAHRASPAAQVQSRRFTSIRLPAGSIKGLHHSESETSPTLQWPAHTGPVSYGQ